VLSKKYDFSQHALLCNTDFGIPVTNHILETIPFYSVDFHSPRLDLLDFKWVMPNSGIIDSQDDSIVSAEVVLTLDGKQVAQYLITGPTGNGELDAMADGVFSDDGVSGDDLPHFENLLLLGTMYDVDAGWHKLRIQAAVLDDNNSTDDDTSFSFPNGFTPPDGALYLPTCGPLPVYYPTDEDAPLRTTPPIAFPVGYLDLRGVVTKEKKEKRYSKSSDSESSDDEYSDDYY